MALQADSESRRRPDEPTARWSLWLVIPLPHGPPRAKGDAAEQWEAATGTRTSQIPSGLATVKSNIPKESSAYESAAYRPRNAANLEGYEQILDIVAQHLGPQPEEILAGAAEEILAILKNETSRDDEKHEEVRKLLKSISTHALVTENGEQKRDEGGEGSAMVESDEEVDEEMEKADNSKTAAGREAMKGKDGTTTETTEMPRIDWSCMRSMPFGSSASCQSLRRMLRSVPSSRLREQTGLTLLHRLGALCRDAIGEV